ncbi:MAG TPA: DUF1176 domain-containing protein [Caulobacteraceae bacterium]|nr:DUF1176 domain-containing protein [Caulobacteraceae bacterium]
MRTLLLAATAALTLGVLGAGAANAAGTKTVKDWTAVCSNLGDCAAFGFSEEAADTNAYLKIDRQAGPAAQAQVAIVFDAGDTQPAQTWTLTLDGKPIAGLGPLRAAGSESGARATLTGAAAQHLIDALRNGQSLELNAAGKAVSSVSLAGSAAILLWVDDQQGRVGTVTALVKKGAAPATSVHARGVPPLIRPAPPASQAGLPGRVPKVVLAHDSECDRGSSPTDVIARLAPGVVLWGPECNSGAYNQVNDFFLGDEHAGQLRPVKFPEAAGASEGTGSSDALMNVGYDPKTQTLSSFSKGRGIADCGATETWVWDGKAFQMASSATMPACRGVPPDDWPTLFVSRQK